MTENQIPVDRLRKPEREIVAYNATFRSAVINAAIQNIGFAMSLVLMNEAKRVEATLQPAYEQSAATPVAEPQTYQTMSEYPVVSTPQPAAPAVPYNGEGASLNDYMAPTPQQDPNWPAASHFEQKVEPAYQREPMTKDAAALADEARQQIADIDSQTNYELAG